MDNRKPSEKQSTQGSSPHPSAKLDASLVTMTRSWKAVRVNGSIVKRIPKSNNPWLTVNSALFYAVAIQKLKHCHCSRKRSGGSLLLLSCSKSNSLSAGNEAGRLPLKAIHSKEKIKKN
ncbi:hypothetical protein [Pedobacter alpinus]